MQLFHGRPADMIARLNVVGPAALGTFHYSEAAPLAEAPVGRSAAPAEAFDGVLVTGSHRSGTTWVGRMLAAAPRTCYLHEPFKPRWDPPYVWTHFDQWFMYLNDENAAPWEWAVQRTVRLRYSWRRHFACNRSLAQAIDATKQRARWATKRIRGQRPVIKDPIALFSSPWLARRFNLGVVMMIRHPAGFVSSIKLKKWHFDFNHFLRQEALMQDLLHPFEREIRMLAERNDDLIVQGILQWRIFHHVIHRFQQAHPDWQFVRHEDLSRDPVAGYRKMYAALGLAFTPACEKTIRENSDERNVIDANLAGKSTHYVALNTAQNAKNWQKRLTPAEVRQVRRGTEDVAHLYYDDTDWA